MRINNAHNDTMQCVELVALKDQSLSSESVFCFDILIPSTQPHAYEMFIGKRRIAAAAHRSTPLVSISFGLLFCQPDFAVIHIYMFSFSFHLHEAD